MEDHLGETAGEETQAFAPRSEPSFLPRGAAVGRYLILEPLGAGGMGAVYAAYDPELDRKVALKLLLAGSGSGGSEGARARLLREAQAMARLSHPNVLTVFDAGTFASQVFIAMELVEGETLREWLARPRAWREAVHLFAAAGRGLAAAHAVGLVHRDFKPDNVLIGKDGRVRVADFGLARPATAEAAEPTPALPPERSLSATSKNLLDTDLTRTGAVLGTPAYMAPEQHRGLSADARADQFSFCVALYQALYGERPFSGDTLPQLADEVVHGRLRPPPKDSRVPARLRRLLVRGLAPEPERRYPSMDALLAELTRNPRRRWRIGIAFLLAVGGISAGILFDRYQGEAGRQLCRGGPAKLKAVWNRQRRSVAVAAFIATKKPFAADAWKRVDATLNGYGTAWTDAYREACAATRLRGEQSEELLDLRMECLRRRLDELDAFTGMLAKADATLVERSVDAAMALTPLQRCADPRMLRVRVKVPRDAAARAEAERLRARIATSLTQAEMGRYREALAIDEEVLAAAQRLGYAPVVAEALFALGRAQGRFGALEPAQRNLEQAVFIAEGSEFDEVAAKASAELVRIAGYERAALGRGQLWDAHAQAVLKRMGGDDRIDSDRLNNLGALRLNEADYPGAIQAFESARELRQRLYGPDHPKVAACHNNVGLALSVSGQYAEAVPPLRRALKMALGRLGQHHPLVATIRENLGRALYLSGDDRSAMEELKQAEVVTREAYGPDHPQLRYTVYNQAEIHLRRGEIDAAEKLFERAKGFLEKGPGASHPQAAYPLTGLGEVQLRRGRPEAGIPLLERALRIREARPGEPAELARSRFSLARALSMAHREPGLVRKLLESARGFYKGRAGFEKAAADVEEWLRKTTP